jgi:hypothetical protein
MAMWAIGRVGDRGRKSGPMADICAVCGFPIEQHAVELRCGVAHTVVRGVDGRLLHSCSQSAGDREYTRGELARMQTIVRSLRYRAGRAWKRDQYQYSIALDDYSNKVEADRKKLLAYLDQWYPWTEKQ